MFSKQCLSLFVSTFSLFLTLSCRVNVVLMVLEFSIKKNYNPTIVTLNRLSWFICSFPC